MSRGLDRTGAQSHALFICESKAARSAPVLPARPSGTAHGFHITGRGPSPAPGAEGGGGGGVESRSLAGGAEKGRKEKEKKDGVLVVDETLAMAP